MIVVFHQCSIDIRYYLRLLSHNTVTIKKTKSKHNFLFQL